MHTRKCTYVYTHGNFLYILFVPMDLDVPGATPSEW